MEFDISIAYHEIDNFVRGYKNQVLRILLINVELDRELLMTFYQRDGILHVCNYRKLL